MDRMDGNRAKVRIVRRCLAETIRTVRCYLFAERAYEASRTMNRFLLLPALGLALQLAAQTNTSVRITDPNALVLEPQVAGNEAAHAGMQAAGLNADVMARAAALSVPAIWPVGLRTDSARAANTGALKNYNAYLVCEYASPEGPLMLVLLPASGNYHMPDDLRASDDLYLVLRAGGVQVVETVEKRPPPSKGPNWKNMRPAKILKPEEVFATYDVADDPEALAELERQGMNQAEIEAVIFRSQERNWPDGIDSFEERFPKLKGFTKYKAYLAAKWGDKVLLVIPIEANRKIDEHIRPLLDIYMVFNASAVEVKARK